MKLIRAREDTIERITQFYRNVIAHTEHMDRCARWIYGQHPTDEMLQSYIRSGAMYYCEKDGAILSALAVTPQAEDYHDAAWSIFLDDDEVSVIHLLCVAPEAQRQGVARETMGLIIKRSQEIGKKAVRLDSLASNTPAHQLYESLGFQKRDQRRWYAKTTGWTDFYLYELCI